MEFDYITNILTHLYIFLWKVGRIYFLYFGVKGLKKFAKCSAEAVSIFGTFGEFFHLMGCIFFIKSVVVVSEFFDDDRFCIRHYSSSEYEMWFCGASYYLFLNIFQVYLEGEAFYHEQFVAWQGGVRRPQPLDCLVTGQLSASADRQIDVIPGVVVKGQKLQHTCLPPSEISALIKQRSIYKTPSLYNVQYRKQSPTNESRTFRGLALYSLAKFCTIGVDFNLLLKRKGE